MYDHRQIEEQWQTFWEEQQLFQGAGQQDLSSQGADAGSKRYLLYAFAYPSGAGLHVGHVEPVTALDILARYYRMSGEQVFFPVGWDAFGLPAENYAIKTGTPPAVTTKNAIDTFRRQIKRIGISYDWTTELATNHPGYYRWTQWLFLELYRNGLAYQGTGMVNWCPSCQTVLANEQVIEGKCERCGSAVIQKEMKQWFFKITEYKDELITGLDQVDWPAATKQQQLHWIGRSEGVTVRFGVADAQGVELPGLEIPCFTTRIDTIFGVTYLAISPEKMVSSGLIDRVAANQQQAVATYLDEAAKKTEEQRKIGEKDKTGVATGLYAINPVNQEQVPIFVTDYVLSGYGTGAVMGVPAHDERDHAFAQKHQLPIQSVVGEDGVLINSSTFNDLSSAEALEQIPAAFPDQMAKTTTYKLRDWLISRQRYWGAPIPIVYDPEGNPHPVKEEHLPWTLPTDVDFKPTGESPLRSSKEFIERTEQLYGKGWRPEFDTMDTFVDSSWYYLRYVSPRETAVFADSAQLAKWLPVDFYMIGPEHIVLHLLYSRFFTKFLRDQNYLKFDEPFMKMRHQGMILGPDGRKMSKSKGNVINPDEVVQSFGADCLRMYEMFMGPIEADKPWNVTAVMGVYRFLQRLHSIFTTELSASETARADAGPSRATVSQKLHATLEKITADIPQLKFNTAIASLMEFLNQWEQASRTAAGQQILTPEELTIVARMTAPFAPFLSEELWQQLPESIQAVGYRKTEKQRSVHCAIWPVFDPTLAKPTNVVIPVQINGKVRATLTVAQELLIEHTVILEQALAHPVVQKHLAGKKIKKQLYIAGRIVSIATE